MGVRHRARANHLTNWKPFEFGRAEVRHVHISERSELTLSFECTGIVRLNCQRPIATTMISTNPERWIAPESAKFYMGF
jgi:hypothetical protein